MMMRFPHPRLLLSLLITILPSATAQQQQQEQQVAALAALVQSPAVPELLEGVDVATLVQGEGFKGMLSTLIASGQAPPQLQPLLDKSGPYLPYVISSYYECNGETQPFFDAINSVLDNPLVKPFVDNPDQLTGLLGGGGGGGGGGAGAGGVGDLAAFLPIAYSTLVTNNPPMYDWLINLEMQCIVDKGYIQPLAVAITEGTDFQTAAEYLPKITDDFFNMGCTQEQLLAFVPVVLKAQSAPPDQQTQVLLSDSGTTPDGTEVTLSGDFKGGPSLLTCIQPNLSVMTSIINVG